MYQFCVRVAFNRAVGGYVAKVYRLSDLLHVVYFSSIVDRVEIENIYLLRRGVDSFTLVIWVTLGLQSKNGIIYLIFNRTYDSDMIYRVVENARNLQYGDAVDYMMKLVELGNSNKFKDCVFEITSDRGGRLEILHWLGSFSVSFIGSCNDFVLIDGIRKNKIYDLSMVITNIVDSSGALIPTGCFSYSFP